MKHSFVNLWWLTSTVSCMLLLSYKRTKSEIKADGCKKVFGYEDMDILKSLFV